MHYTHHFQVLKKCHSFVSTSRVTSYQHPIKRGHWFSPFVPASSPYSDPTFLRLSDLFLLFLMTPFPITACLFPDLTSASMRGLSFVLSCTRRWFFLYLSCPVTLCKQPNWSARIRDLIPHHLFLKADKHDVFRGIRL